MCVQSPEIRTVCAEGFAKLLLARRVVSPSLLTRLLLLWYNPVTEDDTKLRHCIGTFLPIYAFASRWSDSSLRGILSVCICLICQFSKVIMGQARSPEVSLGKMLKFFCRLHALMSNQLPQSIDGKILIKTTVHTGGIHLTSKNSS